MNAVARCSGPRFSPQGRWNQVPPEGVRGQLRCAFSRWGLPGNMRVDNGSPWGSKGDFPTELGFWLIGLGVDLIWNTPRRPQENGVVERSQGTGDRWCEPGTCNSPTELQARLEEMDRIHREAYPYRERLSRLAYYPGLAHSGRPYSERSEADLWDWNRVTIHLSGYVGARRVNKNGDVSIYNRAYHVGVRFQGQDVYVTFDPDTNEWVFSDASGRELRHKPAREITPERIMALDVTVRR
jgi:hypothetical protein